MKKASVLMAALGLVALTVAGAQAETYYKLQPFPDILRLQIITVDADGSTVTHQAVAGNWIASGFYTLPVTGAREFNLGTTSVRRLGIHGTNNGASFGGNPNCVLDGISGGAWFLNCVGGTGATFRNSGSPLQSISCSGLASSIEEVGPPAGQ